MVDIVMLILEDLVRHVVLLFIIFFVSICLSLFMVLKLDIDWNALLQSSFK